MFVEQLFERSADAHLIIDGGAFVDCNQATVDMLRYTSKEEFLRTHPSVLSPQFQPDGRDSFEKANEMMAIAEQQGSHRFEWMHQRADGDVFPVEVLLTAIPRGDRTVIHVVWRDITARKELEQHLRLAQKLEAVGRMAGGIAHDFNNLLVAIIGNAELLADQLRDNPDALADLDGILGAANRAAAMVRELMAFSRRKDERARVIALSQALRDIDGILQRLLDERYQLDLRLGTEDMRVEATPGQIEQVIINLVTNARDAMPTGGRITVDVRRLLVQGRTIGAQADLRDGTYAVLSVSDTGHGMPPEVARRAFDPFFTTKDVGKGTGLGLATVYAIATQHGGAADIESQEGVGTTMRVYWPTTDQAVDVTPPRAAAPAERGSETVLVVEDEPAVATLVVRVLRAAGYRVLFGADGLQALDLWGASTHRVDLVLSDVLMPRLNGVDLARRLRSLGYDGKIVLMSGYASEALVDAAGLPDDTPLLAKPFSTAELLRRVREVIDADQGRTASKR